jgi:hypothetical protein
MLTPLATTLVAALHWDPQLRGALIVLTAIVVLPGSVYLLLATNNGLKLGFLLAVAGLSGWVLILSLVWLTYGLGMKGDSATWKVQEVITESDLAKTATTPVVHTFPQRDHGWKPLPPGSPALAEAQSAADKYLTTAKGSATPLFKTGDYVPVAAYEHGGHNYLIRIGSHRINFTIKHHTFYLKHDPHYMVVEVQPSLPSVQLAGGAATLPAGDVTKPITYVVMHRDVGSKRMPPTFIALAAFIVFAITTERLHHRDKLIMRLKAEGATPLAA